MTPVDLDLPSALRPTHTPRVTARHGGMAMTASTILTAVPMTPASLARTALIFPPLSTRRQARPTTAVHVPQATRRTTESVQTLMSAIPLHTTCANRTARTQRAAICVRVWRVIV